MKQIVQNYRTGSLAVEEVPSPRLRPSGILVRNRFSAISAGTERTKVETARKSLVEKARSRPDLVKKVLEKARRDGLAATYQMVTQRLNEPVPLGYSSVGVVEEVGEWVEGIRPGDLVACAGAGFANHAELCFVPGRLAARCPEGAPLDQAAFTTIGSIALQGVRQAEPRLGERVVVIGMGLIGQITGILLRASGCEVFGVDLDGWKLEIARNAGAADRIGNPGAGGFEPLAREIEAWTRGRGADAVMLTASTASDEPIAQAGALCRERGRVVVVGAVGTRFPREPYYLKEVEIRIARSYGPGRYDPLYEEVGLDYPVGYVRFTEQRNMEAFLDALAGGRISLAHLITHRFAFDRSEEAFGLLVGNARYLGIVLEYPDSPAAKAAEASLAGSPTNGGVGSLGRAAGSVGPAAPATHGANRGDPTQGEPGSVGFIGLGNYATAQLLPALRGLPGVRLRSAASASGMAGAMKAKQNGFEDLATSVDALVADPRVGTVFVATRHDTHADLAGAALRAGKNVFVEKPLCLRAEELPGIREAYDSSRGVLCVGFNRRFAPLVQEARETFPSGAETVLYRVNAGRLPAGHWLKIPEIGGGRLIGEGCHFIDLARYLARSPIRSVHTVASSRHEASPAGCEDFTLVIEHESGAASTVAYFSHGDPKLPKEWIEVHGGGRSVVIDDFISLRRGGAGGGERRLKHQDKGQSALVRAFVESCRMGSRAMAPIPVEELFETTLATLGALESLRRGRPVRLAELSAELGFPRA